jgi:glycosyltransferase involved in cell wall biosynthesis
MVPDTSREPTDHRAASARPYAFLVSTTGCAKGIRNTLGSAAYSYFFVFEALAPVLETMGTWRIIEHPESSLPFAAARAEADGYQPVHLALNPPQDVYLTPALPNVIFPFWEFPDIPNRDFEYDTRQNWVRVCRRADLIVTACNFTRDAFRRTGVDVPISVVPVPLRPEQFEIPAWDPKHSWTLTCRHVSWGGPETTNPLVEEDEDPTDDPLPTPVPTAGRVGLKRRGYLAARRLFRKVYPWLGTTTLERIARIRKYVHLTTGGRPSMGRLGYAIGRDLYRKHVKRWLSQDALKEITRTKVRTLKFLGREPVLALDPLLPSTPLTLSGLVYSSIFNLGDKRKNHHDLLSAYLLAFQDREDVTLVIKLATNPVREHHEIGLLEDMYELLGISHKCRLVVITDFLTSQQMDELMRVTTYYVNTSRAEGACLPLQQSLAAGRPSIAPDHTAMADFMDDQVGFVLRTFPEPTYWPHDPEMKTETYWNRMVWTDLRDQLIASADLVENDPTRYQEMAETAKARMASYATREVVEEALREALAKLPTVETGRFAWAS